MFSIPISFTLEWVEISFYRREKLRPPFYLGSQAFKCLAPTWALYRDFRRYFRYTSLRAAIIKEAVHVSAFWGALLYAIWVFVWYRKRHRTYTNHELESFFPGEINTAANLRATSPVFFKFVRWLNADDPWSATLPKPLDSLLRQVIFVLKYVISAVPIITCFSVSDRLPGEPLDARTGRLFKQTRPEDHKYPAPEYLNQYGDLETEVTSQSGALLDQESAVDLRYMDSSRRSEPMSRYIQPKEEVSVGRLLTPRFLCFINETEDESSRPSYSTERVGDELGQQAACGYVFISYTRRQFYSQIPNDRSLSEAERTRFRTAAERDKTTLIRFAIAAAKEAGVSAFWIDFECIPQEEEDTDSPEVYRICDIVRASHSMAIILGPTLDEHKEHGKDTSKNDSLLEWGARLWTVPEALLCPSEHRIAVYSIESDVPEKVPKRNLPSRVWGDAGMMRQLMDHYEGSLHLTQLELISIALECLHRRQTEKRNAGDVAYALMGLLRLRPTVHKTDTEFQAFARLSLANDSDMILERLLCLSKHTRESPWYDMADTWDAKLWHIKPNFQIASLDSNNAVVIGNASGARVDWTSLHPVDFKRAGEQRSWMPFARGAATTTLSWLVVYYLYQSIILRIMSDLGGRADFQGGLDKVLKAYGIFWLISCACTLPIPAILSSHFRSDPETVQARFFGIEGRPALGQVEAYLYGACSGRLKWSTDCVSGGSSLSDSRRLFTLIDTRSNTATTFRADEPPTLIFVGASAQGMLRALFCSYDFENRTFVKETVVRLENAALQSMQSLDWFRFSVSPERLTPDVRLESFNTDRMLIPDGPELRSLDN